MKTNFLRVLISAVLAISTASVFPQNRALGTWKSFMPYRNALAVCDAEEKIYCAGFKSIFSYEKSTGIIETYDKTKGLSDIGIKSMNYDPGTKALVIVYINSNIDIIYNGTDVYNIPDIKIKATTGAVSINGIAFYNGRAYISSDIGISEIDLQKKEITNTYIIGSTGASAKVYATASDGLAIYAATEEGVKHASLSSSNLQDFSNWVLFGAPDSLPQKRALFLEVFNGKVYAVIGSNNCDTLFEYNGTSWSRKYFIQGDFFTSLKTTNGSLYFTIIGPSGKEGKVTNTGELTTQPTQSHSHPVQWFESNGTSWDADFDLGLFKSSNGNIENILPDGPFSSDAFDIEVKNGVLRIVAGGTDDSWGFNWNSNGFYTMKDNRWSYRNKYTDSWLGNFTDMLSVATVSSRNKSYFGSFLSGLIEMDNGNGNLIYYDKWNSNGILEGATGDTQRTKISALAVDQHDNLWIGNAGATKPVKVFKADGTWREFSIPFSFDLMKKIMIDRNDQLWAPLRGATATGILVWSYNGTWDDLSDDKAILLKVGAGYGNLPNAGVYSLAEDKDGNVWAGTAEGIAVFYCPGNVLSQGGCDADQIKVERDGYIGYLFGTEIVRAIAVDAANRKWIGTSNGLWLVSADGKEEILRFTAENSPLPNNQITDIAIDDKTGEVFIGTIGGLVSYQGDAIEDCSDCDEALVYPNPVKPEYDGPIAIKGLTNDAYVKITDVSGTMIFQGKANGCQMIWDGKGYQGKRASSGVYLVFSSTDLGKEKRVGKILITN